MIALPSVEGLKGKRVLVTGAAGFIGSSLCRVLLSSGAEVVGFDNLANGRLENLDGCAAEVGRHVDFMHGDVRDRERFGRAVKGVEVVFHLACLGVRHSIHSPHENHEVNASGTLTVLSESRAAGVRRVVHVSSSEVYGTTRSAPMTEDHLTDPHTVYGGSKLAGECYARAFHRCYGYDTVVIRPFNAYGPRSHSEGDSGEVIPRFAVRALTGKPLVVFGDGTQTRDLTHVYDTSAAVARAGSADGIAGETFNVGSGTELQIRELAQLVKKVTGSASEVQFIEPRPGDVLRLIADSTKSRRQLGHESRVTLAEGVGELCERLRALGRPRLEQLASAPVRNWV